MSFKHKFVLTLLGTYVEFNGYHSSKANRGLPIPNQHHSKLLGWNKNKTCKRLNRKKVPKLVGKTFQLKDA